MHFIANYSQIKDIWWCVMYCVCNVLHVHVDRVFVCVCLSSTYAESRMSCPPAAIVEW